jgi:hypothetical protein
MLIYAIAKMMSIPYGLLILALLLTILLINHKRLTKNSPLCQTVSIKKQFIENLIRQVYRWHIASTQDENPIIKMLHSNYAVGFIEALKEIASGDEIKKITGLNIFELEKEAIAEQDKALAMFVKTCPQLIPPSKAYQSYIKNYILQKLNESS